jgi:hypothetical protein
MRVPDVERRRSYKTCRRGDVRVRDIMEPAANWQTLAFSDVSHASIDDIVSAFKSVGRSHLVVVEPATGVARYTVRGLFSAAHVGRQLGMTLEIPNTAVTFAQIEMALSGTPALP